MKKTICILGSPVSFPTISLANLLAWRRRCIIFCFLVLCSGAFFCSTPVYADWSTRDCETVIRYDLYYFDLITDTKAVFNHYDINQYNGNFYFYDGWRSWSPEEKYEVNFTIQVVYYELGSWHVATTTSGHLGAVTPSLFNEFVAFPVYDGVSLNTTLPYDCAGPPPADPCESVEPGVDTDNDGVCDQCDTATSPDCQTAAANNDPGNKNCENFEKVGSSVNVANGNLFDSHEISPDGKLPITLYYNSRSEREGLFGYGWNADLDIRLLINSDDSVVLIDADGREDLFTANGDGSFASPIGHYATLAEANEEYLLTRKNGETVFFNADGKQVQIEDRNGNATTYGYDGDQLLDIIGPNNQILSFTSDTDGRITNITDAAGKSANITYDADGNLTSFTNVAGQSWAFAYDVEHNIISKNDPLGQTTQYTYNDNDQLIASTDAAGTIRNVEYVSESVTKFTDSAGNTTEYSYNENQNITKEKDALGNITEYIWDENFNKTGITAASGTTSYSYDESGNRTSVTNPDATTTSYAYNAYGQVTSVIDPAGGTTFYAYDGNGNLIAATDPAGNTTSYEYDAQGRIIKIMDANNRATSLAYDAAGNLVSMTDPTGAITTMAYDASGNMISMKDASGATTAFVYDSANRMISTTDSKGNSTKYSYDAMGNRTAIIDANNNPTSYEYNSQGQVVRVIDALGNITSFTYGAGSGCSSCSGGADKLTALTDANGRTTAFSYDSLGRLIKETNPLGNVTSYSYDASGNLVGKTDAQGFVTTYSYDPLGRLLTTTYPDGSTLAFTYDAVGNMLTAANRHIAYSSMTYDVANRLVQITDSNNRTISYEYDALGNRVKMIMPDNEVVEYFYDNANRLTKIDSPLGMFEFSFDALGRRTGLIHPNGVATTYSYDNLGRLIEMLTENRKGDIIAGFNYSHDKIGNRLSKLITDRHKKHAIRYDYTYDDIYRLLESMPTEIKKHKEKTKYKKAEVFGYDPVGNRVEGPKEMDFYTYDQGNQLLSDRRGLYQYDANGNLLSKMEQDDDGIIIEWIYEYDYDNRLVKVVKTEDFETKTVTFKYDPFGRRIEKRVEEADKAKVYTYVYDNEDIIFEYLTKTGGKKEKVETTRYVHGPGIDEPLAIEQKGKVYCYHADGLGSIVSLTDEKGKVVQSYEYSAFGEIKRHGNKVKQPYSYTGREYDEETGLYFYRARYYDPAVGRFISKDPIGFAGGDVNLFAYVQNQSINFIDPDGLIRIPGAGKAIGWGLKRLVKTLGGKLGKKLGEWSDFFNPDIGYPPEQQEMDKDSDKDGISDHWDNDDDNDGIPDAQDDTPKEPNNTEKPCE